MGDWEPWLKGLNNCLVTQVTYLSNRISILQMEVRLSNIGSHSGHFIALCFSKKKPLIKGYHNLEKQNAYSWY